MLLERTKASDKKRGRGATKHPGIVRYARLLGCSRIHLWYVLEHRRESKPLMERLRELQKIETHLSRDAGTIPKQ
ncbi:MAG: hypothetical protein V9H26_19635 [Verrucomicrobiota bacterium]